MTIGGGAAAGPSAPLPGGPLSAGVRRGYALGSVATGTFGTVPGLLLLPYLTDTLDVAALLAGVVVVVPKAWDIVLNPIAGRLSDRTRHPAGRRRPYLLIAGIALAVFFALLFNGPVAPRPLAVAYVVVLFVLAASAYAFFQVPYIAMPAEMTTDPRERTRLMAWRVAVLALAILIAGASAPAIRTAIGGRAGYRVMAVAIAVLLLVGALGAFRGTRAAPSLPIEAPRVGTLRAQLAVVGASAPFRSLLGTFVLQALATGIVLAGVDYVARYLIGTPDASTVLFACFVGPALVVTPVWERFARTRGKRAGYVAASVLMAIGMLGLISARGGPHLLAYAAVVLAGIGYAGCQVFPLAMLPDVAEQDATRSGANRIGVFTGIWTAGETLGLAVGPGAYALVLALGDYVSSGAGTVHQPDSALTAIAVGFSLLPGVIVALSLLVLRTYRLQLDQPPHGRPARQEG